MENNKNTTITNEELRAAFTGEDLSKTSKPARPKLPKDKSNNTKKWLVFNIIGGISLILGVTCLLLAFFVFKPQEATLAYPTLPSESTPDLKYSALTGEVVTGNVPLDAPTYCIQMPNGTDGARPQAGLTDAGVVFEAIAEAGITRFAAIYQDPSSAIIGPVRSLRIYYLQWDTPFDCTIVHAGGSGDALTAVANGYKNLDENYSYMYRGTYGGRLWNNLFTTSAELKQFTTDHNYDRSEVKGFSRLTPVESEAERADKSVKEKLDITKATAEDTSAISVPVPSIALRLGGWADFNVNYTYDAESNTYLRSYANGSTHQVYKCGSENLGEKNPEDVCTLTDVTPSVVVAMMVQESKASDNYHEDITAIGSGKAYIFQNGIAIEGNWTKSSTADQIKFTNSEGQEIKLAPGQTFVTTVPNYGSVEY